MRPFPKQSNARGGVTVTSFMETLRILCLGDVVGQGGVLYLEQNLRRKRDELGADMVVVNGENAAIGNGLDAQSARRLFDAGADVLTSGNHIWQKREIRTVLEEDPRVLRPANYPASCPGAGYHILCINGYRILVMNVMGTVFLDALFDPFVTVERILDRCEGQFDFAILDIHAEATSEKIALARFFDGRVSVIFGTHTHVQTADACILPRGSAYMTDLGMTGPVDSILGVKVDCILAKFRTHMPVRVETADGAVRSTGFLAEFSADTGKALSVRLISF